MYLVFKRTAKDQRRTKDEPRNDQRTPNYQNVLLVKIAISFTSLILCLIPPTDDRETTERTPTQLPVTKKCFFLRLLLNQVVLIPKKVDSLPEIVYLSVPKKNTLKCDFSCTSANFVVPLHREPTLGMSAHQRRRVADIIKRRLLALVLVDKNLANFHTPKARER